MDRSDTLGQLRQLPDLAAEVWMTKGHKNPSDRPLVASRSPFPKCPADLEVIDCLTRDEHASAPLYTLTQAVRAVWEDLDADQRPALTNPPTWISETQWLLQTAEVWQADPWLSEYVADQVWGVWRELARAARVQPTPRIPCIVDGCWGHVVAIGQRDDGSWMWPDVCENNHRVDRHEMARRYADTRPVTIAVAAVKTGIPWRTLHRWVEAGMLQPRARRGNASLYLLSEIRDCSRLLGRMSA